jgi:hypothetical protein
MDYRIWSTGLSINILECHRGLWGDRCWDNATTHKAHWQNTRLFDAPTTWSFHSCLGDPSPRVYLQCIGTFGKYHYQLVMSSSAQLLRSRGRNSRNRQRWRWSKGIWIKIVYSFIAHWYRSILAWYGRKVFRTFNSDGSPNILLNSHHESVLARLPGPETRNRALFGRKDDLCSVL